MNTKKQGPEKKKFSQTKSSPSRSRTNDLPLVVISLIIVLMYGCSVGCVSFRHVGGDEPEWKPKVYKFDSGPKCLFIGDSETDLIDVSDDNILHDYVLIKVDEFKSLMHKMQQCEAWR